MMHQTGISDYPELHERGTAAADDIASSAEQAWRLKDHSIAIPREWVTPFCLTPKVRVALQSLAIHDDMNIGVTLTCSAPPRQPPVVCVFCMLSRRSNVDP